MGKTNPFVQENLNVGGRVLFVVADNFQNDNVFPLGPGYLAACLRLANVEVETYCMDAMHYTLEELELFLKSNSYDIICLGFMAPRFKRGVQATCRVIKEHKNSDA
jgi:hypothetical protein